MLFKIEAEVKRATRAIEMLEAEGGVFASKLEEVTLETETSKKSHGMSKIVHFYSWLLQGASFGLRTGLG